MTVFIFTAIGRRIEGLTNFVARFLQVPIDFLAGFLRVYFSVMKRYAGIVFRLVRRLACLFTRAFVVARRTRSHNKGTRYQNRQFHAKYLAIERPFTLT